MKPKMRVTLLDEDMVVSQDRLVDQYTELLQGPSDVHKNPYRLEVTLTDADTIDRTIDYINKLRGKLPIDSPKEKTKNPKSKKVNPYREIFLGIKAKSHIEDIETYLEECNFRYISPQLIEDLDLKPNLPPEAEGHQVMVRVLKYAKDPLNDKFDFRMMVLTKFLGKPSNMVYVFYDGNLKAKMKKAWRTDKVNMKEKKVPMVFPKYMTIEERKQWRQIRRNIELGRSIPEKKRKFHDRYLVDIKNVNPGKDIKNL